VASNDWATIGTYPEQVTVPAKSTNMIYIPLEILKDGNQVLRIETSSGNVSDIVEKSLEVKHILMPTLIKNIEDRIYSEARYLIDNLSTISLASFQALPVELSASAFSISKKERLSIKFFTVLVNCNSVSTYFALTCF
jgi:hypothetical protein